MYVVIHTCHFEITKHFEEIKSLSIYYIAELLSELSQRKNCHIVTGVKCLQNVLFTPLK